MWRCPSCETINNEPTCVVCGEKMPVVAYEYREGENVHIEETNNTQSKVAAIVLLAAVLLPFVAIIASVVNR